MKSILVLILVVLCISPMAKAANPSFASFGTTNQFTNDGTNITIRDGAPFTNPVIVGTITGNIENPLYVSIAGPSAPGTFTPTYTPIAAPGQGFLVQYTYDFSNVHSLFPDGRLQYTNATGVHDPSAPYLSPNGHIYNWHTYQNNIGTPTTNIGMAVSDNWTDWTPSGPGNAGYIPVSTFTTLIHWAPDIVKINGTNYIYYTSNTNNITSIRAVAAIDIDTTATNFTAPANSYLVATNQAGTGTGPFGGLLQGLNDCYMFVTTSNTTFLNSAGVSNTVPSNTVVLLPYNLLSLQYDVYTNAATNFPASSLALMMTNITAFPKGSEGGSLIKSNGNYLFQGAQAYGTNGQSFISTSSVPGWIGCYSNYKFYSEVPVATFGQKTWIPLYGADKSKFEAAIARAAQMCNPNLFNSAAMSFSTRRLPGWSGDCLVVRRDSDNATLQIGFVPSGFLDTNKLLTFIGANNGFVECWFDQSGNCRHAVNVNHDTTQPKIVAAGVLQKDGNGFPTLKWDGSTTFLKTTQTVPFPNGVTVFSWVGRNWATAAYACVIESSNYLTASGFGFTDSSGGAAIDWATKNIILAGYGFSTTGNGRAIGQPSAAFLNSTNNGTFYLIDATASTTLSDVAINGVSVASKVFNGSCDNVSSFIYIGGNPVSTDFNDGNISEVIAFSDEPNTPRKLAIRGNILSYYGTANSVATANPSYQTGGYFQATNGFTSTVSNATMFTFTMPASGVNFTNPFGVSAAFQIDNTAVTGTAVKKNGVTVFSGLSLDITIMLRAGETFSETYTVGTPTLTGNVYP